MAQSFTGAPVSAPPPAPVPTAGTTLPPLTVQGDKKTSVKRANGGGIR